MTSRQQSRTRKNADAHISSDPLVTSMPKQRARRSTFPHVIPDEASRERDDPDSSQRAPPDSSSTTITRCRRVTRHTNESLAQDTQSEPHGEEEHDDLASPTITTTSLVTTRKRRHSGPNVNTPTTQQLHTPKAKGKKKANAEVTTAANIAVTNAVNTAVLCQIKNSVTAVTGDIIYPLIEHAVYDVTTKAHPCHIAICKRTLIIKQAARPHIEGNGESLCQIKNIVTNKMPNSIITDPIYTTYTLKHQAFDSTKGYPGEGPDLRILSVNIQGAHTFPEKYIQLINYDYRESRAI